MLRSITQVRCNSTPVYCLEVALPSDSTDGGLSNGRTVVLDPNDNNFFANGILAHNVKGEKKTR